MALPTGLQRLRLFTSLSLTCLIFSLACTLISGAPVVVLPTLSRRLYSPLSESISEGIEVVGVVLVAFANALLVIGESFSWFKLDSNPYGHHELRKRVCRSLALYYVSGVILIAATAILLTIANFDAVLAVLVNFIIFFIAYGRLAQTSSDLQCLHEHLKIANDIVRRRSVINSKLNRKFGLSDESGVQDWGRYKENEGIMTSRDSLRDMAVYKTLLHYTDKWQVIDRLIVEHVVLSFPKERAVSYTEQTPQGLGPYYIFSIGRHAMKESDAQYLHRIKSLKDFWKTKDPLLDSSERERIVHGFFAAEQVYHETGDEVLWALLSEWIDQHLRITAMWTRGAQLSEEGLRRVLLMAIASVDRYVIPTLQTRYRGSNLDLRLLPDSDRIMFTGMFLMEAIHFLADQTDDQLTLAILAEKNASLRCRVVAEERKLLPEQKNLHGNKEIEAEILQVIEEAKSRHSALVEELVEESKPFIRNKLRTIGRYCEQYTVMAALVSKYGMLSLTVREREQYAQSFHEKVAKGSPKHNEYSMNDLEGTILEQMVTSGAAHELVRRLVEGY